MRHLFGRAAVLRVLEVTGPAHRACLLHVAVGGRQREALRHQVVAGVAVGHVDDVALLADAVDIGAQDHLHVSSPVLEPVVADVDRQLGVALGEFVARVVTERVGGGPAGRGGGPSARPAHLDRGRATCAGS